MAEGSRSTSKKNEVKSGRVLEFDKERETKGAVRYAEVEDDNGTTVIRTIYLRKELFKELGEPDSISVTIKAL